MAWVKVAEPKAVEQPEQQAVEQAVRLEQPRPLNKFLMGKACTMATDAYDKVCPSVQSKLAKRTCDVCTRYYCSNEAMMLHRKTHADTAHIPL